MSGERKHGRKKNRYKKIYKDDLESSGEWKHGKKRKGWRVDIGRIWRGAEIW